MTETDLIRTIEALNAIRFCGILKPDVKIGLHSCNNAQRNAVLNAFPDGKLITINKEDWDILTGDAGAFGLLCFFNVFHYMPDPVKAFLNVLNSCSYLLIQDLMIRNRGNNTFGEDGDCMRYAYGEIKSNFQNAFDLSVMKDRILFFTPYVENVQNLHFISVIKGNL